jgi:hypothetical protein
VKPTSALAIDRIVSGGQTGADRAALDFAIAHHIKHGGWCPAGRKAEDGVIDSRYQLEETPSKSYSQRTKWNVRDSDGTVVFTISDRLQSGSRTTVQFARKLGKPWLHLAANRPRVDHAVILRRFIGQNGIRSLNVAGPRKSDEPEIGKFVTATLRRVLAPRRTARN